VIRLPKALGAWNSPAFAVVLQQEIEHLDAGSLPLQQGLSQGSYASPDGVSVMLISTSELPHCIRARAGIHFTGIIAGCNCADDPTPVDGHPEYCEMQFDIDRQTAETTVTLLQDEPDDRI
jgi:hypothetical protein